MTKCPISPVVVDAFEFKEEKTKETKVKETDSVEHTDSFYTPIEMIGAVLNVLYQASGFFRNYARLDGTVVYGSLLWRIIRVMTAAERSGKPMLPDQVLLSVLCEIQAAGADIDMFVGADVKFSKKLLRRGGRGDADSGRRSYGWLAYRHEKRVLASTKDELQHDIQTCNSVDDLMWLMSSMRAKTRTASKLWIETIDLEQPIWSYQIKFQVHKSPSWSPAELLDDIAAPFFTVETLMRVSGGGVSARFGADMDEVIRHIQNRELHLVNPDELSEYLDNNSGSQEIQNRLKDRLLKYKKYGFKLCFGPEDLRCAFVPTLIFELMIEHIRDRNKAQKRKISKGIPIAEPGDDDEFKQMSDDACASQSLYNDYNSSIIGVATGAPSEICDLIAEFAARADEHVYNEDPIWQEDIRAAREQLARVIADEDPIDYGAPGVWA